MTGALGEGIDGTLTKGETMRILGAHLGPKLQAECKAQYTVPGACITYFVNWTDEAERERLITNYNSLEII